MQETSFSLYGGLMTPQKKTRLFALSIVMIRLFLVLSARLSDVLHRA